MSNNLFLEMENSLVEEIESILEDKLSRLPVENQIGALNRIRTALHELGPLSDVPIDNVQWVRETAVKPNDYNPNKMARPEWKLLELSIERNGITQPVVVGRIKKDDNRFVVVDGEHRAKWAKKRFSKERWHGFVPVVVVKRSDANGLKYATIEHNRARGVHGIMQMKEIIKGLFDAGATKEEIMEELGLSIEEIMRFMQWGGIAIEFSEHHWSEAWE